jgi:hypothetical protein
MSGLNFARTTMWFVPSSAPLLRDLIDAATNAVDADGMDWNAIQSRAANDRTSTSNR